MNQPSKFTTKDWVEINDESRRKYKIGSKIRFKILMLKSRLYDYSNAYILVSRIITITGEWADNAAKQIDRRNKGVIYNNCVPFFDCISETNNTQIDHAKDLDVVTPIIIEYNDNYSKTSGQLCQCYRDELAAVI